MAPKKSNSRWFIYIGILCGAVILALFMSSALPGIHKGYSVAAIFSDPTSTVILYDPSRQMTASPTPFQPLPTETLTPTPTNTPVPTATATSTATLTPLPTSTSIPTTVPNSSDGTSGADVPIEASISGVIGNAQNHNLSCESRSAVDWAHFFGVSITESDFQSNLPPSDNPELGFVGYVDDPIGQIPPNSYGVYAGPVAQVLRDYGLSATAWKGYTYDELQRQIAAGKPVIVWIIGNTWSGSPSTYTTSDGTTVTVAHFEHTAIVTGYDEYGVTLVDNNMVYWRTTSAFLNSWNVLGNMAISAE
jgi:uncharacterized protein YvpB